MDFHVHEIFKSIQGESTYAGLLCTFIRFAGCNLTCSYCDTIEAQTTKQATAMSLNEIVRRVDMLDCPLIELTGGEPLLQDNIIPLTNKLLEHNYTILIETNGTLSIQGFDDKIRFIMDVKCPGSGMTNSFLDSNIDFLKPIDELKFVLTDRNDYIWAKDFIIKHHLINRCNILLSPVWSSIELRDIAEWIREDNLSGVRLQIQLHKLIWGAEAKGV